MDSSSVEGVVLVGGFAVAALIAVGALMMMLRWVNEWWYVRRPGAIPAGLKLPPGSMGWPVIGDNLSFVRLFKRDPEHFIQQHFLSRTKGHDDGIYKAHLFGHPCIITCSPDMNKFVLGGSQTDGQANFTVGWPTGELMGPTSMIMVEGLQHKRMRKLLLEAITHPSALRKTLTRLEKRIRVTLAQWAQEKNICLREKIKEVTFGDICDAFLSLGSGPLSKKMMEDTQGLVQGVRAYPIKIPGFTYYHSLKCRKSLMESCYSIVKHRRLAGMKGEVEDFLDVLLKAKDEEGNGLSDTEICDNLVSFLIGGHESTTYAMLWTMILLAKNPKVMSKLREEHNMLKAESKGNLIDELKKATYTDAVLNEVLRVVNIAFSVFRTVARDDVNYKGYYFPKDWKVISWLRAPHMDPSIYADPLSFNPDRFLDKTPRLGQFMPFGHGPRLCPGNILALSSARLFIHISVTNYKWNLVNPNEEVKYLPHPKPIDGGKVVFEPL
ncbi:hypothetical protein GOP47_0011382 [Adiantum capillus-veneris]|uniref:Cytochrome P450 n=1 Tax=Adiantum capillus-veneris TaxID=13818 RepID=A0A9D4USP1_ADICA|nr:hypothetical protein GOP47_0011382 [Adiantum capillus-veneris]